MGHGTAVRGLTERTAGADIIAASSCPAMEMNSAINLRTHLADLLRTALVNAMPEAPRVSVVLERPKSAEHGDYACNVAMQLAKPLRRSPREIAQGIVAALPESPLLSKAEIAGAGFINLFLMINMCQ